MKPPGGKREGRSAVPSGEPRPGCVRSGRGAGWGYLSGCPARLPRGPGSPRPVIPPRRRRIRPPARVHRGGSAGGTPCPRGRFPANSCGSCCVGPVEAGLPNAGRRARDAWHGGGRGRPVVGPTRKRVYRRRRSRVCRTSSDPVVRATLTDSSRPTRLETRTKESNMCASHWVQRNPQAQ